MEQAVVHDNIGVSCRKTLEMSFRMVAYYDNVFRTFLEALQRRFCLLLPTCRKTNGYPLMLVGYMRVSSDSDRQSTDLQRDALLAVGVDPRHLFEDHASGAKDDRAGLARAVEFVHSGDVLVVWKLDRLGRSLSHLLAIVT